MNRGVDATRNFATAAPDGVKRNSGSSVRLPTTVMVTSPAAMNSLLARLCLSCLKPRLPDGSDCSGDPGASARLGTDDLGAQDRLVESELPVEFGHGLRRRLQVDDRVDSLGLLVDL